ncbi:hypothetical protein [Salinicoccus roseus]|uniref:hypothetical protein n=1 Tax=Salinicoccus roseus TaxID=45670 RepID=UPI003565442A
MNQHTYNQLKYLIDLIDQARLNKEKVYTIPEEYEGAKIESLTDREGFLEYILSHVQNVLIDETTVKELEDELGEIKKIDVAMLRDAQKRKGFTVMKGGKD